MKILDTVTDFRFFKISSVYSHFQKECIDNPTLNSYLMCCLHGHCLPLPSQHSAKVGKGRWHNLH